MLAAGPRKRATITEVLGHSWMIKDYGTPPRSYVPLREPLTPHLDDEVISRMDRLHFNTSPNIKHELLAMISLGSYGGSVQLYHAMASEVKQQMTEMLG